MGLRDILVTILIAAVVAVPLLWVLVFTAASAYHTAKHKRWRREYDETLARLRKGSETE